MENTEDIKQEDETTEEEEVDDTSTEETETDSETEGESTDDVEGETNEAEETEDEDDTVTLPTGERVTHEELVRGYMKDADYRRKTADLARERESYSKGYTTHEEKPQSKVLEKYNPQQVEEFKTLARELGFVTKEEYEQFKNEDNKKSAVNVFFKAHPEYSPENDRDGLRYNALREELSIYNTDDPSKLPKILEKAHKEVESRFSKSTETSRAAANKARVKAASVGSHGTGKPKSVEKSASELTDAQIAVMRQMGVWSEE